MLLVRPAMTSLWNVNVTVAELRGTSRTDLTESGWPVGRKRPLLSIEPGHALNWDCWEVNETRSKAIGTRYAGGILDIMCNL